MQEELEAQAVEEPVIAGDEEAEQPRPLPERSRVGPPDAWRGEVRTAAIAAAGGLVAGAATVAAVRAVRAVPRRGAKSTRLLRRDRRQGIVASRSFLVDVHVLGR